MKWIIHHNQVEFAPGKQSQFNIKKKNVIHHINKTKNIYMIISTDTKSI